MLETKRSFIELAKYSLIYDAFEAASADEELHDKERQAISKLGQALGLDESTIAKIAQLHQDEVNLRKRRAALLFPGGIDENIRRGNERAKQ